MADPAPLSAGPHAFPRRSAALLVLLTAMPYLPSLGNPFIWEDRQYLIEHPATRDLRMVTKFFVPSAYLAAGWESGPVYRPLTSLTYLADQQVWGSWTAPRRAVNLVCHLAAVLLVWRLASGFASARAAFWAALLYGLHPAHGEAIFWVMARATVLATALALAGLWAWARGFRARGVAFLCAGLLAKETAVAAFLALPFFDAPRRLSGGWRAYGGAGLLLGVYLVWRFAAVPVPLDPALGSFSAGAVAAEAAATLADTAWIAVWPWTLAVAQGTPHRASFGDPLTLAGCALAGLWLALFLAARRRWPAATAGLALAALAHLPAAYVLRYPGQDYVVGGRQLHLPLAGLALVAAVLLDRLQALGPAARRMGLIGVAAVGMAFGARIMLRGMEWRDGSGIAAEFVRFAPERSRPRYLYAYALQKDRRYDEAAREYREALRLDPGFASAALNLGVCEKARGRPAAAAAAWRAAARAAPGDPRPWLNLGNLAYAERRVAAASAAYREALRRRPDFAEAHRMLGKIALAAGRMNEAETHFAEFERIRAGAAPSSAPPR